MFTRNFRIETLNKIIAEAAFASSVKDAVENLSQNKSDKKEEIPNKPIYEPYNSQPFSIPVSGATVWVPTNPIIGGTKTTDENGKTIYKGGKYNVFVWVRPGNISSGGKMKPTSANAIVVTVEAGGMGSSQNTAKYGSPAFLNGTLSTIDSAMKSKFGDVSVGNVGLGAFSGGYDAVGNILLGLQKDPKLNDVYKKVNAVMMLDNMHNDPGGAFKNYAKEAANDPTKKFIAMYSQIKPGRMVDGKWVSYKSAREAAEEIANEVGAEKNKADRNYGNINPNSVYSKNGVKLIEAFPEDWANQPSRKYDSVAKKYVGPLEGTLENQHVMISSAAPDLMDEIAPLWNI